MKLGIWTAAIVEAVGLDGGGNWSTIAAVVDMTEAAVYADPSLRAEAQANPHSIGPQAAGLVADVREWLASLDPTKPACIPPACLCPESRPAVTNGGDIVPRVSKAGIPVLETDDEPEAIPFEVDEELHALEAHAGDGPTPEELAQLEADERPRRKPVEDEDCRDPTPDEIHAACAKIRTEWTPEILKLRGRRKDRHATNDGPELAPRESAGKRRRKKPARAERVYAASGIG